MGELPIFPGLTEIHEVRAPEAPRRKTLTFESGATQSWVEEPAKPGQYRAVYRQISDEQLQEVEQFFESHKSPQRWRCLLRQGTLENCYFLPHQTFPPPVKHADQGYTLEIDFQAAPR
jgi:hypothetical protein